MEAGPIWRRRERSCHAGLGRLGSGGHSPLGSGGINAPTAASRRNTAAGGPSPRRRAAAPTAWRYPRKNGLVLDQQIVEFALLHAFDQGGDLGARVNKGGAIGVA